jgi:hypothetical protein
MRNTGASLRVVPFRRSLEGRHLRTSERSNGNNGKKEKEKRKEERETETGGEHDVPLYELFKTREKA